MDRNHESYMGNKIIQQVREASEQNGYIPVTLITERGNVICKYYPVDNADKAAIWVGGVGGDFDTPAKGLYPKLSEKLVNVGISSLRIQFRHPNILEEAVYDLLAGITFLEDRGVSKIALIGHSFGGAVVIQAGTFTESVTTILALSAQSYGADVVSDLPLHCSILLIHGDEDTVLPDYCSRQIFTMAHEPKQIIIFEGNGHTLDESAQEIEKTVYEWIVSRLK